MVVWGMVQEQVMVITIMGRLRIILFITMATTMENMG